MGKSWIFFPFSRSHGKLIYQEKGHGKVMAFCTNRRSVHDICCGSLLGCIYKFTTFVQALSCM